MILWGDRNKEITEFLEVMLRVEHFPNIPIPSGSATAGKFYGGAKAFVG
jgi:hypothetical protein